MLAYPASFTPEPEGGYTVTFRDVPEAITWADTEEGTASMAVDALETALSVYVDDRKELPRPSAVKWRERSVPLSALGMAKAALARRLNCHLPQIDRLLDFCHASKLEQIENAFATLGKRLVVDVRDAA